jgi:hypothetical protein
LLADAVLERLPGARAVRCDVPPIVGALLLALDRAGGRAEPHDLSASIAAAS